MKDNYESTGIEGIKEDIKVQVIRGEANKAQSISEGIEKTFDGDMNTIYHSPYNDNKVTEESPAILTYYFDEGADMDYLVYYPRTDGGANGRFKEVEIRVRSNANTYGTDEWTTVIKKNLGGSSSAARIDFPVAQIGVSAVQIVVNSGVGDFASCAEMEFYKKNPDPFDYSVLFTDASCSELKPGVTEEDIQNCNYSFFKNIAYYMYRQKYPREFRIAEFKAYPHPDIQKAINKTSAYSLLDNPTGIYVAQGQELVVLVADAHNEDMGICIQNLDKPGGDGFGGDTYPLTTGVNKIKVKNKGLVYVIYHTTSLEELAGKQPVKIHFASGKVNGYFDSNKHEASRWSELLNNTVCGYFDVLGTYAHLTFPVNRLRNSTGNRGKELIDLYDEIVEKEQIFMGLKKYGGMFMNRMYLNVMYHNFMYASDYHTAYHDDTMDELCNPDRLKTTGCWGPAHEIGHCNQTRPGLKWHGLTEVTNNIMSQYIQTTVWGNTSRLQSEGWYTKAWDEIIAKRRAHAQETRHQPPPLPLQRRPCRTAQPAAPRRLYPERQARLPERSRGRSFLVALHRPHPRARRPRLLRREPLRQVHGRVPRQARHQLERPHEHGPREPRHQRALLDVGIRPQHLPGGQRRQLAPRRGVQEDVRRRMERLLVGREPCRLRHQRRAHAHLGRQRVESLLQGETRQGRLLRPEQSRGMGRHLPGARRGNLEHAHDPQEQVHQLCQARLQGQMARQPGRPQPGDERRRENQPQRPHHRLCPPLRHLQARTPSLHRPRPSCTHRQQREVPRSVHLLR